MDFPNREEIVKNVQRHLNLLDDGKDGPKTWDAISGALGIKKEIQEKKDPILSQKSLDLIIKYEVGSKNYYTKYLQKPTWPQGASGVTIGIGYDLGYNTLTQFRKDWGGKISENDFNSLSISLGVKGSSAFALAKKVSSVSIPWTVALEVFIESTLPRFINDTLAAFPQSDKLHPDAFGALVSIVFNRGSSLTGSSRVEMLRIRSLVLKKDYSGIAREIRSMKRLWVGKGLDGLLTRREEEAKIVENCS